MTPSWIASSGGYRIPSGRVVQGVVRPPSSKSLTQRALNLGLLSRRPMTISRPLRSEDTDLFMRGLTELGLDCVAKDQSVELVPGPCPQSARIWCGNNGTMLRFLTASVATLPGEWTLDGSERLRQRPIGPLVEALRRLGASIEYRRAQGFAPVEIRGGRLPGGRTELDASLSSQFVSAVLMAAARAGGEVILDLEALTSAPYLRLTLDTLESFGAAVSVEPSGRRYRVRPGALGCPSFEVEGDFSSAAYPAAAAVLTGGSVVIQGVSRRSHQGDRRFLDILSGMGADLTWDSGEVEVRARPPLVGVEVDLSDLPDQVPTLAALAPFARGRTIIRNVYHLRIKESDRLSAMAGELRRIGAEVRERRDGLEIEGCWAERDRVPTEPVEVQTHGDHRIAMSLAVCGLVRPGVLIASPQVVTKSYPQFWNDLNSLIR